MAKELLRALPSIDSLLASPLAGRLAADWNRDCVRDLLREILSDLRQEIVLESALARGLPGTRQNHEIHSPDLPIEDIDVLPLRSNEPRQTADFLVEIERRLAI